MKNHIAFKFIAIALCAACLLGAVGGIAGIVVLTEGDLYNKTVDQMLDVQYVNHTYDYATWLARNYASTEWGACSDELVEAQYGGHWFDSRYDPEKYGYAVVDAEGNELLSYNADLRDGAKLYTNTITGRYMHFVSAETESEVKAREAKERIEAYGAEMVIDTQGNTIPAEGAIVHEVIFADENGQLIFEAFNDGQNCIISYYREDGNNDTSVYADSQVGFLHYSPTGHLVFHSFFDYLSFAGWFSETEVCEAYFTLADGTNFRIQDTYPIGSLYLNDTGNIIFTANYSMTAAPEETAEETVPESVPETVPQEAIEATAVPETVPEATEASVEETSVYEDADPSSASAMPEETQAPAETEAPVETAAPEETEASTEATVAETQPEETVPAVTEPVTILGKTLDEYQINHCQYYDSEARESITAQFVYVPMPELTVEIFIADGALRDAPIYDALAMVREYRNYLLPVVGICLLLFAALAVYLCTAAGRTPNSDEVRAGGLNRIPLDGYLFGGCFAVALMIAYLPLTGTLMQRDFLVGCGYAVLLIFLSCLIFVGFCFAFVAQIKMPNGFWWRNTLCGRGIRLFMRFGVWLEEFLAAKGFPFLGRLFKKVWQLTMISIVWMYKGTEKTSFWLCTTLGRVFRWLGKRLHRFLCLLPLTWQWMLAGFSSVFLLFLTVAGRYDMGIILSILFSLALVLYGAHCFGILSESTRRMSKGDLNTKVDDRLMVGCFKESAADLNALADVAMIAAQKRLQSERMKTELITNVSHDIKTPLTSIINYVDLLQKPHTEEEEAQYLEVLDRQSQRLKKLIDDLMDMSKASTGNMAVEITQVDAVESVNQALGEFADKLDRAQLYPVFRHTEESMPMMADGRLVWRVLSNLLSNAVKYAMPGTRLYVDVMTLESQVVISLKNISREELNINADELMERFVRGDDSRNTEGSGLGLNIAKSLMELQKGQLQLLVDGDLFKVTLIFPGVQ